MAAAVAATEAAHKSSSSPSY
eukprot:COSAG02_NODE_21069_length_804_cov_1.017021_1_plen_20_part_10